MLLLCSACYLLPQWVTLLDPFTSDIQDIPSISLWYVCHWLWYGSLVSRPGKYRACRPVKCSPTVSAEYLSGLIWWFIYRYFLGSCTHSRYSWAFGTLKQQCQHPDLRGIPSRFSTWGAGMDTGPRVPVLSIIREEVRRERGTPHLLTSPSIHHWPWDQGGRDTGPAERHDQHTEHHTPHWESETRHVELKWQILLIDLRVTTADICTLPKAKYKFIATPIKMLMSFS